MVNDRWKGHAVPLLCAAVVAGSLACRPQIPQRNVEVTSRTTISGSINGGVLQGSVIATLNTGAGGRSSCDFARMPDRFTPGTLATHT